MKHRPWILVVLLVLCLGIVASACQRQNNVCQPLDGQLQQRPALADLIALPPPTPLANPLTVEIGGNMLVVDKLVDGPLCNDRWRGTVYVSCAAQVAVTNDGENPLFLKGCNLSIEPNTVVYVAAHNDAAYFKGCSCHTGENPLP